MHSSGEWVSLQNLEEYRALLEEFIPEIAAD